MNSDVLASLLTDGRTNTYGTQSAALPTSSNWNKLRAVFAPLARFWDISRTSACTIVRSKANA